MSRGLVYHAATQNVPGAPLYQDLMHGRHATQWQAQGDSSLRETNGPISYKRDPWMSDPAYAEGEYRLVRTFIGIRGRRCHVYLDPHTGEEVYSYGPLSGTVI